MRKLLIFFLCAALLLVACNNQTVQNPPGPSENLADAPTRFSRSSFDFFDTLSIIIGYAQSQEEFDYYSGLIHSELQRMHILFDIFNEYPGINNIRTINQNAGIAPVEADPLIIELIEASKEAYRITDGTVNIALGPVLEIWHAHRHAEMPVLPDMEILLAANAYTNIHDIIIDAESSTVFLPHENMSLDVGGVAKGFALEVAVAHAREAGFESFLLNMGGDVLTASPPPGRDFWNVAVESPTDDAEMLDVVSVSNMAVLASGDYRRFFVVDDVAYSHLIDPATLMPARHFRSVAVIHPSALYAEILSTAIFIMELDRGKALLQQHGAEAIWLCYDSQIFTTPGYGQFSAQPS